MAEPTRWAHRLEQQRGKGLFRQPLPRPAGFADFCSNDFLGLGQESLQVPKGMVAGGTGSRHVSGLHKELEDLERWAAVWLGAGRAVYFPSGFQANLAVVQALATRHDVVLMDERIHASFHDAARLTLAKTHLFKHNSLDSLQQWLGKANASRPAGGEVYVVTEGVFSMAATQAPLAEMQALCRHHQAYLIVDEAHSLGFHGRQGRGLCEELEIDTEVAVRVFPLGKAAGSQGALVVGSALLGQMLENFARPLIYSTAPAPLLAWSVLNRLQKMAAADDRRLHVQALARQLAAHWHMPIAGPLFPVQPVGETAWPELLSAAAEARLWVKPIRYPTVPKGEECLRITLHAHQSEEEMTRLHDWLTRYELRPLHVSQG